MRIRFTVLGTEVWCLQIGGCDCADVDDEDGGDEDRQVAGGSSHDFERDTAPLDPTDHYGSWEDRTRFGFGGAR